MRPTSQEKSLQLMAEEVWAGDFTGYQAIFSLKDALPDQNPPIDL